MSTLTVVDEIKLKAPNWSRDGARSILAMMNRAQNYLFSKPSLLSVYVDPATGDYPWLVTASTVMDYAIPNVPYSYPDPNDLSVNIDVELRIHSVREVFSEQIQLHDYGFNSIDPYISNIEGRKVRWKFTPVPANEDRQARVILPFDPGATTEKYKLKELVEPLQLSSDSIPLMVQQDDEEAIIEGALAWIEYFDYGRSDRLEKFKNGLARDFWNKYKGVETIRAASGTSRRKF